MPKAASVPLRRDKKQRWNGRSLGQELVRDFKLNKYKYLLVLPILIYLAVFAYKPMYGLVLAFKDYRPALGIDGSKWVGFKHFINWFTDPFFFRVMRNTISISLLNILFGFPAPIILALLLNEIRNNKFKRLVQTVTYMPYFISMVVVCALIRNYVSMNGIFSQIAVATGGQASNLLLNNSFYYPIYIASDIWQYIGWNSIIYLAAIAGIDQEQYEAARIDGAHRLHQIFLITLPNLMPTIIILFILRMGGILNVGFEKTLLLYNESVFEVADIIQTYVYRRALQNGAFSFGVAVGLFNSVINVFFLLLTNGLSRRFTQSSLF
jgi:putative aldouronate transport system permease protein